MRIDGHVEKFRRFDALRGRFDPIEEFELWYWMGLSGGTAIINAALHALDITKEDDSFSTQVPDVYVAMQPDGGWRHQLGFGVDLIHVGLPPIEAPLPEPMQRIFAAMEIIERYRDPCTRGRQAVTAETISDCDQAYRTLVGLAQDILRPQKRAAP
jgi:hypothetical protein